MRSFAPTPRLGASVKPLFLFLGLGALIIFVSFSAHVPAPAISFETPFFAECPLLVPAWACGLPSFTRHVAGIFGRLLFGETLGKSSVFSYD